MSMRITILANQDLASNLALNLLFERAPQHAYDVLLSKSVGRAKQAPADLQTLRFVEQTLFNQIVYPLSEGYINSGFHSVLKSFKGLEGVYTPSTCQPNINLIDDINSPQGIQRVASHKPELIISIRFGQILQQPMIDLPELGVINLHSGLLPQFRGVMATFWAMLAKQKEIGTSLHFIDSPSIDAGRLISTVKRPLDFSRSYLHNVLSLYPRGVEQIVSILTQLDSNGSVESQPMDMTKGVYHGFPSQQQLTNFKQQGLTLVDIEEIPALAQRYWAN